MALSASESVALAKDQLIPAWLNERRKLDRIDRWARWDHDDPAKPRHAQNEYRELIKRSQAPWGDLIVSSIAQTLYVEGYRRPDDPEDGRGWALWQANGMDGRQVPLNRATLTYGLAYGTVLPGRTLTGEAVPVMRGVSPRDMLAVFDDPAFDEWPVYALQVRKTRAGYVVKVFDDLNVWTFVIEDLADNPKVLPTVEEHGAGVCPVVRFTNRLDLEGRVAGEIEPFIPVLGKVDQTSFDRLVVQRFASWIIRTISGMSPPEQMTDEEKQEWRTVQKLRLLVEDMLVADDPDTKFGSLPATPLDGFIKAHDADLTTLAAVSQTPAFELLGQMANLSAEALAAAKASQTAKSDERKHTLGEEYERFIRLACHVAGDTDGAEDFKAQVRWADTSIRSLAQAADALGKLAQMLGMPVEVLWRKVPGLTDQDVDEARQIVEERGGIMDVLNRLADAQEGASDDPLVA